MLCSVLVVQDEAFDEEHFLLDQEEEADEDFEDDLGAIDDFAGDDNDDIDWLEIEDEEEVDDDDDDDDGDNTNRGGGTSQASLNRRRASPGPKKKTLTPKKSNKKTSNKRKRQTSSQSVYASADEYAHLQTL